MEVASFGTYLKILWISCKVQMIFIIDKKNPLLNVPENWFSETVK